MKREDKALTSLCAHSTDHWFVKKFIGLSALDTLRPDRLSCSASHTSTAATPSGEQRKLLRAARATSHGRNVIMKIRSSALRIYIPVLCGCTPRATGQAVCKDRISACALFPVLVCTPPLTSIRRRLQAAAVLKAIRSGTGQGSRKCALSHIFPISVVQTLPVDHEAAKIPDRLPQSEVWGKNDSPYTCLVSPPLEGQCIKVFLGRVRIDAVHDLHVWGFPTQPASCTRQPCVTELLPLRARRATGHLAAARLRVSYE